MWTVASAWVRAIASAIFDAVVRYLREKDRDRLIDVKARDEDALKASEAARKQEEQEREVTEAVRNRDLGRDAGLGLRYVGKVVSGEGSASDPPSH